MKFCMKCGEQLSENSSFCVHCGAKVKKTGMPEKPAQESKNKKELILAHITAGFISILIFCGILMGTLIFAVRSATTDEAIRSLVYEIDIANIRVGDMLNASDSDMTLSEYIYEGSNPDLLKEYSISESDIEEILEDDDLKDFLSEKLSEYSDYIYSGGTAPKVTAREIIKLLEKNEKTFYRITGYQLGEEDYRKIRETLDGGELDLLDMSLLEEQYGTTFKTLNIGLSYSFLMLLTVIELLLCILLYVLYREQIADAFLYLGITFIAAGFVMAASGLFSGEVKRTLNAAFTFPDEVFKPIVSHMLEKVVQSAAVALIVGGILLTIYIVLYKRQQKTDRRFAG